MSYDDEEEYRYGDLIPPKKGRAVQRMYQSERALAQDGRLLHPGWGLGNLVQGMRHRSAARLADARTHNAEAWRRFLSALNDLGEEMIRRERMRRRLENLDEILDEEEAHEQEIKSYERMIEIYEVKRRLRLAKTAYERADGAPEANERKKHDPLERLKENIAAQQRLKKDGEQLISQMKAEARASGIPEDDPQLCRDIENAREELNRILAGLREKG